MTVHPTEQPHVFVVGYWVNLTDQSCDCKHGCYNDTPCAHLKAAAQYVRGEPVKFWEGR